MKKVIVAAAALLFLAVAIAGGGLVWAHVALRRERTPLPALADAAKTLASSTSGPRALWWINSASQNMPRAAVLAPARDPAPTAPYRMSHPSFVLEWGDGRLLLVDVGMTAPEARDFGKPSEIVVGASPMETHGSTAERLGARLADVDGVLFSHLHTDHVEGMTALCRGRTAPLRVFGTTAQLTRPNYTTRPGLEILRSADCVELVPLDGSGPLLQVPGFPGVRVVAAGGHTPGSQVVLARVGTGSDGQTYVFTGDVVNALDGIRFDLPKPWWYSTLVIPEDPERLGELRRFLRSLHDDYGATLLVQHDERSIEEAGVPHWAPARSSQVPDHRVIGRLPQELGGVPLVDVPDEAVVHAIPHELA